MKVILRSDITNVGKQGEIKEVAAGFARNFLLPKKLGMEANSQNLKIWEREKSRLEKEREEIISNAKIVAEKIEKDVFSITVKVGENGKIFGSITTTHLAKMFASQGFVINKHDILLPAPIKEVGKQSINIRLHPEVIAKTEVMIIEEKHKA
ncbi:MAG: 50S ribosomal protein L9 [Endomicrobiia bacterium]|nr:50S ribosomal protein L9 [Endomicrobiaceae bacterium]MDD3053781.1 50S ribosomal protein L9 [Endomicrobiaceae bacterium]MDD3922786.1 50S ribosomal protein L9 [Endomicrobiaceae bacterium]MDD5101809.1 50S ribosomal protein L9 [Endomicrobiaceae bacterium]